MFPYLLWDLMGECLNGFATAGSLSSNPSHAKLFRKKIMMEQQALESYAPPIKQRQMIPGFLTKLFSATRRLKRCQDN